MTAQKTRRNWMKQCDVVFSQIVRSRGFCQIKTDTDCLGALQCCHGFSRGYKAIRCDERNAWAGCARHHQFWTAHPEEWRDWMRRTLGDDTFYELKTLAYTHQSPDWKSLLLQLKESAASLAKTA